QAIHVEASGLPRLADVLVAEPGYEAALAAALGPLADAFVAADSSEAARAGAAADSQITVMYPYASAQAEGGSLMEHVHTDPAHGLIARCLLGRVVVGRDVTLEGVFRSPGMVRAGKDARAEVAARRAALRLRIAELTPVAEQASVAARRSREAERRLVDLRAQAVEAGRIEDTRR